MFRIENICNDMKWCNTKTETCRWDMHVYLHIYMNRYIYILYLNLYVTVCVYLRKAESTTYLYIYIYWMLLVDISMYLVLGESDDIMPVQVVPAIFVCEDDLLLGKFGSTMCYDAFNFMANLFQAKSPPLLGMENGFPTVKTRNIKTPPFTKQLMRWKFWRVFLYLNRKRPFLVTM